jgi:NAD(P)-dependent dehydrogenase (short-subunit alcohol dehydrogenase family)
MSIEMFSLQRINLGTEANNAFADTGLPGDFADLPFQEGSAQLALNKDPLNPQVVQQLMDARSPVILGPKMASLTVTVPLAAVGAQSTSPAFTDWALGILLKTAFGGVDMLVLNAGIFPPGAPIATLPTENWRRVLGINLDASFVLLREAHPFLKLAPKGGRVAVIGSKNVPAPGPGAASYSASKAAPNQLVRVAALEWGKDGIRLNTIHPNAVFDTGLWTPEIIAQRAKSYGLSVEAYKTNNVLRTEITSHDVAELAAELCGPLFAKTTAAQVPVDGGKIGRAHV